jgi:hypothetical protein
MAAAFGLPDAPLSQPGALTALLNALPAILRELRLAAAALLARLGKRPPAQPYDTLWLELALDLTDTRGERAVLTRRQCLRFHGLDSAVVRELVWGDGDQLVRYTAAGARRLGVRAEGSKRAVLLSPDHRPGPGDRLTITSRRTIRGGFRAAEEYSEAFLERPTGRLTFSIRFPSSRPPKAARLVLAATETTVRRLRPHYGADGRAVLRCQIQHPVVGTAYSLRWSW